MKKYKNLILLDNKEEKVIKHGNKEYYRYMDRIYIPNRPENLSLKDIVTLSEIRLENEELINYDYTKKIISYLLSYLDKKDKIIDFGCGNGIINELITNEEILGLDASDYAVDLANERYKNKSNFKAKLYNQNNLLKVNEEFDAIISSFVMHFGIYEEQLIDLYLALKPKGKFVYNDYTYKENPKNTILIEEQLKSVGFKINSFIVEFDFEDKKKIHKIVIAEK